MQWKKQPKEVSCQLTGRTDDLYFKKLQKKHAKKQRQM